jgi:hypothetical protein
MRHLLKIILIVTTLTFISNNTNAQPVIINRSADFIEVDNQGNIYTVKDYNLIKYNNKGKILFKYSDRINGNISSVDVTNPLRILVFFKESNVIVFLDWQLLPISDPVSIFDNINIEADAVCTSSTGNCWIYAGICGCITLYNKSWENIQQTENLSDGINGNKIMFIRENNQHLYLGLSDRVLVFDIFGYYLTTIHLKNADNIKFADNYISYVKNNNLFIFNIQTKQENIIKTEIIPNQKIFFTNNSIYKTMNDSIFIYQIKN